MTEIHIHGPVTIVQHNEMPAKTPNTPPRPARKPPTDNGGRLISRDGTPLTVTSAAKRDSGPKTRWRVWPYERPEEGKAILIRFELRSVHYDMIAYIDDGEFFDDSGRLLFRSDNYADDFPPSTVFTDHEPESFKWVLLDELLKGVE